MATIQQLISNKSTLYHVGDGYFYRRLKKKGNKLYLTCDNAKCSAIGVTNINFCEPIVLISVKHNHRPIVNRSLVKVPKSSDPRRCCQAGIGKTMYDKKYKKFDLKLPGLASVRKLSSLPLVTSMAQYAKLFRKKHFTWLSKTRSGQRFFVKLIEDHTMLFISPATKFLLKELEITYIISINRTCYFIPNDIQPCMLVTVLGIYENKEIPIVFALMKCCCTSTYEQLLRSIIDEEPGWKPQTIIVDYDDEIRTAIKHVQPTCQLFGNWYHFSKDIRTRLHNMKLVPIINEDKYLDRFVRMCIALPLLPASMVQMGFEYVSKTILCRPKTNKFKSLLNHIKNYWIDDIKAKELSVKYDPRRINNYCEEYIGYLTQLVGIRRSGKVNPTVLTFNAGLIKIEHMYSAMCETRFNRVQARGFMSSATVKDIRIAHAIDSFRGKIISLAEYLNILSSTTMNISEYDIDGDFPIILYSNETKMHSTGKEPNESDTSESTSDEEIVEVYFSDEERNNSEEPDECAVEVPNEFESTLCKFCAVNQCTIILVPCCHSEICKACIQYCSISECPTCFETIQGHVEIDYKS